MLKAWSVTSCMWILLCLLAGALLGAMMARVLAPASTPDSLWKAGLPVQFNILLGALLAALVLAGIGFACMHLDRALGHSSAPAVLIVPARVLLDSVIGVFVGTLLGFIIVGPDFQQLRVAMFDFQGAPLVMGALAGGVIGALRGVLVAGSGIGLGLKLVMAVGGFVVGVFLGLILGAALAALFIQFMIRVGA